MSDVLDRIQSGHRPFTWLLEATPLAVVLMAISARSVRIAV